MTLQWVAAGLAARSPSAGACRSMPRFFFSTVKQCQLHKLLCTEICGFKTQNNQGGMGIKRKRGVKIKSLPQSTPLSTPTPNGTGMLSLPNLTGPNLGTAGFLHSGHRQLRHSLGRASLACWLAKEKHWGPSVFVEAVVSVLPPGLCYLEEQGRKRGRESGERKQHEISQEILKNEDH